jgi:hypothetical protein
MGNEDIVVLIARDMIFLCNKTMITTMTDIEVVNQSLALSIRAISSLVSMIEHLHWMLGFMTSIIKKWLGEENQKLSVCVDIWREEMWHHEFEEEIE